MASRLIGCVLLRTEQSKCRVFCEHPSQTSDSDLAVSLVKFHEPSSSDLRSIRWLCDAMDVVITTQEAVKEALCKQHLQGTMKVLQVQQFFEDIVKLLDVCCVLKDGLEHVNAYTKAAQVALKHLSAGSKSLIRAKKALNFTQKLRAEYGSHKAATRSTYVERHSIKQLMASRLMLQRMGRKLTVPEACNEHPFLPTSIALPATVYGAEMVTLVLFRLLATVLSCATKSCQASAFSHLKISSEKVWTHPLLLLQAHLRKVIPQERARRTCQRSIIPLVPELHMIDESLDKISDLLVRSSEQPTSQELRDNLRHHSESMLRRVQELQGFVNELQKQFNIVCRSLVDVRMVLLDCLLVRTPMNA